MRDAIMLYGAAECRAQLGTLLPEGRAGYGDRDAKRDRTAAGRGQHVPPGEQTWLSSRWEEARFADLRYFGKAARGGDFSAV